MIYKAIVPEQTKEQFEAMLQRWAIKDGAQVRAIFNYMFTEGNVEIEYVGERFILPFLRDFGLKTVEVVPVKGGEDNWTAMLKNPIRFHMGDIRTGIVQDLVRHALDVQGGFWSNNVVLPGYEGCFYSHVKGTGWGSGETTVQPQLPHMSWEEVFKKLGGPVVITDLQGHWEAVNKFKVDVGRTSAFREM